MKTYLHLPNAHPEALPEPFAQDDVRYPPDLVRTFLAEYTQVGEVVFDPFAHGLRNEIPFFQERSEQSPS